MFLQTGPDWCYCFLLHQCQTGVVWYGWWTGHWLAIQAVPREAKYPNCLKLLSSKYLCWVSLSSISTSKEVVTTPSYVIFWLSKFDFSLLEPSRYWVSWKMANLGFNFRFYVWLNFHIHILMFSPGIFESVWNLIWMNWLVLDLSWVLSILK